MEKEICRREVERAKKNYKWPIILSVSWMFIALIINCGISGCNFSEMRYGPYWAGWGNMILGAVLAGFFILLHFLPASKMSLVLTDKRIYVKSLEKSLFECKLLKKEIRIIESYNLKKIDSYALIKNSKNKLGLSQLSIKTLR
jgi:hypothetical protein